MQSLTDWITGKPAPDVEPQNSLLQDWKSYSGQPNNQASASSDRFLASAEEGASAVGKIVGGAFNTVAATASGAAASVSSSVQK
jgi:hypothetical protein